MIFTKLAFEQSVYKLYALYAPAIHFLVNT